MNKSSILIPILVSVTICAAAQIVPANKANEPPYDGAQSPALDASVVDACRACHHGPLDLAGRDVAELETVIATIESGGSAHPMPLPALSEPDRRELAEALATAAGISR